MKLFDAQTRFLAEHALEFIPAAEDQELLRELEQTYPQPNLAVTPERVQKVIERLETRVFLAEKDLAETNPDAKRILLTAAETLAFRSILPVIDALRDDRRVRSIGLMTDNLAAKQFEGKLDDFQRIRDPAAPMLVDAMKTAAQAPFDVALVPVDPKNSPNASALFGAKSVFGAKKLYFLSTGWVGVGNSDLFQGERAEQMESIDGIFVGDQLAADIVAHQLPDYPRHQILETGTPIIDSLDLEHAADYTHRGREKLQLDDDTIAVLLMGFVSPPPGEKSDLAPRISEDTFARSFDQIVKVAADHPEKKIAILVRPHPTDPNSEELFTIANRPVPPNLAVRRATNDVVTMQEAAYGADVTASIAGTDNFLAPRRGRQGVFLGYEGAGMGGTVLDGLYGKEIVQLIDRGEGLTVAKTPEEFATVVINTTRNLNDETRPIQEVNRSVERMLDIMLS